MLGMFGFYFLNLLLIIVFENTANSFKFFLFFKVNIFYVFRKKINKLKTKHISFCLSNFGVQKINLKNGH